MAVAEVATEERPRDHRRWLNWADWRATVILLLGILLLRVIYLVWLDRWELVGDEAQYWVWSRHLSPSYYSKGPGVALLIAASTRLLGDVQWAIRLPAALSSLVAALVLARLTIDTVGDERAGFLAALAFKAIGVFQLQAQIMTIDPPFMALWLIAAWLGWHVLRKHEAGRRPWLLWGLLGLALGAGFLVKYITVLLPPGLLLYAFIRRDSVSWDERMAKGLLLAILVFAVTLIPWIVWNAEHGWPAIRHELGHLGVPGGDMPAQWEEPPGILSTLELLGAQIGMIGPPAFVLIVLASLRALRERHHRPLTWPRHCFMLSAAVPTLVFFFALSPFTRVQGNWPVTAYLTLLVLLAEMSVREMSRWDGSRRIRTASGSDQDHGDSARMAKKRWVTGWRWLIGWGIFTASILALPGIWSELPLIGDAIPMWRIEGAEELSATVDEVREIVRERTGEEPLVIAARYGTASQLSFYLDGQPTVLCADAYVGMRESHYDYMEETDLTDPALHGKSAVLVLRPAEKWAEHFAFDAIETLSDEEPEIHVATGYGGPRVRVNAVQHRRQRTRLLRTANAMRSDGTTLIGR